MIKTIRFLSLLAPWLMSGFASAQDTLTQLALPTARQILWQEMEQTMFVHFDPATWQGGDYDNHSTPLDRINPARLDVNQWIDVAESWGAKMILFVAKHAGGFCWWQTKTSGYSIGNTPYRSGKGDVLAELAQSCEKRGMKLGVYIYPGDESFGAYLGGGGRTKDPGKQEAYNKVLRQQWEEVLSRTGNVTEIWFDGSVIVPLKDIVKKYAPEAIVFQGPFADIRWVGNERGFAPYPAWNSVKTKDALSGVATAAHGDPDGECWMPVEVDVPLKNHNWFWSPVNRKNLRTLDELMEIYYKSVGRGCQLLLNSAPDTNGLIPPEDVALYRQFGDEIRKRFGKSLAETSGKGDLVELGFGHPTLVDHVIIQEDIAFGERVRRYVLEGFSNDRWIPVAYGLSVGHKRIDRFKPLTVTALRFRCLECRMAPVIRRMAAYFVNDPKAYNTLTSDRDDFGNRWTKGEQDPNIYGNKVTDLETTMTSDSTFEVELSAFIPLPGQYSVTIKNTENGEVRAIEGAELLLMDQVTPGFATTTDQGKTTRINITAYPEMKPGSIKFRGKLPAGTNHGKLSVFIREMEL